MTQTSVTYLTYMEELLARNKFRAQSGPVITVSREYGCPGIPVSEGLVKALTGRGGPQTWRLIDRQVLEMAAEKLKLSPELIEKLSRERPRSIFGQLMESFAGAYIPHDIRAKRAMAQIIRAVADEGHAVILGRGGVTITRDIQASLHIHLHASVRWRKERVKQLDNFSSDEDAYRKIEIVDRERVYLRNFYAGEETDENMFDLSFNCEYLTVDQIVSLAIQAAQMKRMIG